MKVSGMAGIKMSQLYNFISNCEVGSFAQLRELSNQLKVNKELLVVGAHPVEKIDKDKFFWAGESLEFFFPPKSRSRVIVALSKKKLPADLIEERIEQAILSGGEVSLVREVDDVYIVEISLTPSVGHLEADLSRCVKKHGKRSLSLPITRVVWVDDSLGIENDETSVDFWVKTGCVPSPRASAYPLNHVISDIAKYFVKMIEGESCA